MALLKLAAVVEGVAKRSVKRAVGMRPGAAITYSWGGEDMIVRHLLGTAGGRGFYVDVGAGHPTMGSNTYHFYRIGWRGVTIEPQLDLARAHRRVRPKDVAVACAVGASSGTRTLLVPKEGATMAGFAPRYGAAGADRIEVPARPLREILGDVAPGIGREPVTFLSVDVEGAEIEVLQSNDWASFRPTVVCVEAEADSSELQALLDALEYDVVATISIIIGEVSEIFAVDRRFDWAATQHW
jgi:FkbM family methyltransferase